MKAVILAGGEGTRLRPLTYTIPKPLIDVRGKTLTEHVFDILKNAAEAATKAGGITVTKVIKEITFG